MNRTRLFISLFFLSLLMLGACKDPNYIEFLEDAPEEDFDVNAIDTFIVTSSTVKEDTLDISEFSADLLGVLNDSIFGLTHYSHFFQVELPKVDYDFGPNPVAKSAELRLRLNKDGRAFGNTSYPQKLMVYKLNEQIYLESRYVTGTRIPHEPAAIGTITTTFDTIDSVLTIPLNQMFAASLLPADSFQYASSLNFKAFMNGLAVVPDTIGIPSGEGGIVPFLLTDDSSQLVMRYSNDSGDFSIVYPINSFSARISGVGQNYSGTPVADQLASPQKQFQRVFAQPHGGVKIKLVFPTLRDFVNGTGDIALMQAKVYVPAITDQGDTLSPPTRLLLYGIDENGKSFVLPDAQYTFFGGSYDATEKRYQFIITQYLQNEMLQMKADPAYVSNGVYIIVKSDNPLEANRLVARAKADGGKAGIRLLLTFTKLD